MFRNDPKFGRWRRTYPGLAGVRRKKGWPPFPEGGVFLSSPDVAAVTLLLLSVSGSLLSPRLDISELEWDDDGTDGDNDGSDDCADGDEVGNGNVEDEEETKCVDDDDGVVVDEDEINKGDVDEEDGNEDDCVADDCDDD